MTATKHWHAGQTANGNVHVWPCGDSVTHVPTDDCDCLPKISLQQSSEGDIWIYTHQAADGRPFAPPNEEVPEIPWFMRVWAPLPTIAAVGVFTGIAGFVLGVRRQARRRFPWQ